MAGVASREPSSTMTISKVRARAGSVAERLDHQGLEVRLLVVGREEVRQPVDAVRPRSGRRRAVLHGLGRDRHGVTVRRPTTRATIGWVEVRHVERS